MIIKYKIFISFLLFPAIVVFLFCAFKFHKDEPFRKVRTIVIDPGHGGKDPGCNGVSCKEKDVALAVSLKLGKLINQHMKDVKVIFTRETDIFVELEDRAKIANDNNADLFISIHCNAAGKPVMVKDKRTGKMRPKTFKNSRGKIVVVETSNPAPYGAETYVMGLKNEGGKMKVAQRENSAMLLEDNYEKKYEGFDPNSEESYIIMSNYTSSYVIQSANLGLKIQEQYANKAGRLDKGVHRQSIWVLWRTSMPSVLTELGYLTNPQEEKFLGSEKGQTYLSACLFRAFRKYKDEQEGVKKKYDDDIENQTPLEKEVYVINKEDEAENNAEKKEAEQEEEVKAEVVKSDKTLVAQDAKIEELIKKNKADSLAKEKALTLQKIKNEQQRNKVVADSLLEEKNKQAKFNDTKYKQLIALADMNFSNKKWQEALELYQKANEIKLKEDAYSMKKIHEIEALLKPNQEVIKVEKDTLVLPGKVPGNPSEIIFKVQFASVDKEVDPKIKFPDVSDVWFYKVGVVYKYTSGNYTSMEDAAQQQTKLKALGYKDCFVAAFKNNVRMDINEAKRLVK